MPRRVSLIMLLGFAATLVLTMGMTAGAAPGDEVASREAEISAAQDRLMEIRMEAGTANESFNNALYEMNQLNGEIAAAEEDLTAAEDRLAEAQRSLEERASQVYKSGNVGFADVLVGVDNFSEFAARMDLWLRLLEEERAQFEAVRDAKNELADRKAQLEDERAKRVETVKEAADLQEKAAAAETEAEDYLASLNADLRDAIQAEQERQAQLAAERAAAAAAEQEPVEEPVVEVEQVEQPGVPRANLEDEQAAAERAAAADAAAAEAERQAQLAAEQAAEEQKAAEEAAAEREAAKAAAARKDAREEERQQAELAEQRAAERQAAREEAQRQAEEAAEQAAIERAAARQAKAEQLAAERAAERRAEREAAEQAAIEEQRAAEKDMLAEGRTAEREAKRAANDVPTGGGGGGSGDVISVGQEYLGTPYVLGGLSECVPYEMMDCSCFTMTVFSEFGIALPDSPGGQMGYGTPVKGAPAAGDLLFWSEDGSGVITHVGIAMGDGTTIHASVYEGVVTQGTPIDAISGYVGAERLL